ncbi:MAG: hypothetical protein J5I65_04880 [Aridibacter famidurans]|nr:hypothetical protein [Aridibacter famidurans]
MKEFTSLGHFPFHREEDWDFLDLKGVNWMWGERLQEKATPNSDGVLKSPLVILIARRYASTEDALDALSIVRDTGPEGKYLIFNYSLVKEDTLFSLWGACYFDIQTWDSIKRKLNFAVLGEGHVPSNFVSIPCESKRSEPREPFTN